MSFSNPDESWGSRITRWVVWSIIGAGALLFWFAANPDSFASVLYFGAVAGCVYLAIRAWIVDPLMAEIKALRSEVAALRRRIAP